MADVGAEGGMNLRHWETIDCCNILMACERPDGYTMSGACYADTLHKIKVEVRVQLFKRTDENDRENYRFPACLAFPGKYSCRRRHVFRGHFN